MWIMKEDTVRLAVSGSNQTRELISNVELPQLYCELFGGKGLGLESVDAKPVDAEGLLYKPFYFFLMFIYFLNIKSLMYD